MQSDKSARSVFWVALNLIQSMEPTVVSRLTEHFGGAEAAWKATAKEMDNCEFLTPASRKHLAEAREKGLDDARNEIAEAARSGAGILTRDDEGYPAPLSKIHLPPPLLYIKGKLPADECAVAIVGTRKCTAYGKDVAGELAAGLAKNGVTVVSGLAYGIDTAAHQGALKAGGRTVAVLGAGLNVIYPAINRDLSEKIAETGALVSEFPMNTGPEKWNFPRRNRIISGLCKGVVVVEAPAESGALITATFALEQGREVFAVPGNVKSRLTKGTHQLLRDGAALVESVDDILNEINIAPKQAEFAFTPNLAGKEEQFFGIITDEPVNFDEICRIADCTASEAASTLTMLEMKGLIRQLPGRMFVRQA